MDGASGRGADAQVVAVATAVGATKRRPPHALEVDVGGVGTTSAQTALGVSYVWWRDGAPSSPCRNVDKILAKFMKFMQIDTIQDFSSEAPVSRFGRNMSSYPTSASRRSTMLAPSHITIRSR